MVYSVNGNSGDTTDNVNVDKVDGNEVNADVSNTANFTQYSKNTSDVSAINGKLTGLTASADEVLMGQTFVGEGGLLLTGTNGGASYTITNVVNSTSSSGSYTFTKDYDYVVTTGYRWQPYGAQSTSYSVSMSNGRTLEKSVSLLGNTENIGSKIHANMYIYSGIKAGDVWSWSITPYGKSTVFVFDK